MKAKTKALEFKVGLFASFGVGLTLIAIWMLGSTHKLFASKQIYYLSLSNAEGIASGASVLIAGVNSGIVEDVSLEPKQQKVRIKMSISARPAESIRQDSVAQISSHGVLGDKIVVISAGDPTLPPMSPGSVIPAETTSTFSNLFGRPGDRLLGTLNEIALHLNELLDNATRDGKSAVLINNLISATGALTTSANLLNEQLRGIKLKESVDHLNSILSKADNGQGSVSALLNDPQLYDDAKTLFGEINRNRIVRNLVRKSLQDGYEHEENSKQQAGSMEDK